MRLLVIGGTQFIGRHLIDAAIAAGHDVTMFNRGRSDPTAFPDLARIVGDRDSDLSGLAHGKWDATIDLCAYTAPHVYSLIERLGSRAGQYVFISTISVFDPAKAPPHGLNESAPLLEPDWGEIALRSTYGEQKVAAELETAELVDDALIIRPGIVLGLRWRAASELRSVAVQVPLLATRALSRCSQHDSARRTRLQYSAAHFEPMRQRMDLPHRPKFESSRNDRILRRSKPGYRRAVWRANA
jgi:nucleoside-diphosphate-sugar epimerase